MTVYSSITFSGVQVRSQLALPAPASSTVAMAVVRVVALLAALVAAVVRVEGPACRRTVVSGTPRHSGG